MNKYQIPRTIKHIVWDWNGTLLDDAWLCVDIMNHSLAKRNLQLLTLERYREMFRFPVREYYIALGFDFEKEPFTVSGTEFIDEYEQRKYECALQPCAAEILDQADRAGFTQSLLSAYRHETLESFVEHFGLRKYFRDLSGLDDHYASGKLENGLLLMERLPYPAPEVLFIGDTVHDFEVATAMGVHGVLVPSGHSTVEKLTASGAPVVDDLRQVAGLLSLECR